MFDDKPSDYPAGYPSEDDFRDVGYAEHNREWAWLHIDDADGPDWPTREDLEKDFDEEC